MCHRSSTISHLLFADDCLLFCRATHSEAQALRGVLTLYVQISGQAVNYIKSGTFFSVNVDVGVRVELGQILGISQSISTGRYFGRGNKEVFAYVCDWLWKKLNGWRGKKLSKARNEVLIA